MNVPNALTLARILLIPLFGWLWATGHHRDALIVYGAASFTDWLDGLAARALNQYSRLGAVLDPAADKLMLLVSFLVAASTGAVPWWLAGIVIGRDLVIAAGTGAVALVFRSRGFSLRIHPTRLGKYSTFFQMGTILTALLARALDATAPLPYQIVGAFVWVTAVFTVAAGVQYMGGAILAILGAPAGAHPPHPPYPSPPYRPIGNGLPSPRSVP